MEFSKDADKGEHDLDEDALDVGETGAEARSEEGRSTRNMDR